MCILLKLSSLLFLFFFLGQASVWSQSDDQLAFPPRLEKDLSAGTTAIYFLDFDKALHHFDRAIKLDPEHPAAHFFKVMLTWYRLTYDVIEHEDEALEKELSKRTKLAIEKAKRFSENEDTKAAGYLYLGGAYGNRGWYHLNRDRWIRAYLSGKKGYKFVKKAVKVDPSLWDAYLGIGIYEYFAATLGPTLKILASFHVRGDKKKALEYLNSAESKSRYVQFEAAYFLWNLCIREEKLDEALGKIEKLKKGFPGSPLFDWYEMDNLYRLKKWNEFLEKSNEYVARAMEDPEKGKKNPFQLMLSKVYYFSGRSSFELGDYAAAQDYFEKAKTQESDFKGWQSLAVLRQAQIHDLENDREQAISKYKKVLKKINYQDAHKQAKKGLKKPFEILKAQER